MVLCVQQRRRHRRMAQQQQQQQQHQQQPQQQRRMNGNNQSGSSLYESCYHGDGTHQRDPPPYPGHFTQFYTPGYRQSYSGSETSTDLSLSSSENLNLSARQDPQGEENSQLLTNPLDGFDGDPNYGMAPGMGRGGTGVEVKSSTPGTFYVTGGSSRSSSTSPPQSDVSDISNILQFIKSSGAPSYTAVSPAGSFASNGSGIYSMANQYLYQQPVPVHYHQHQQQPQIQPEAPKKLQRPKSANVPLTKDVVRDLQQQANKFLEEQCQQYLQQNQDHCLQQHLQRQQQLQQQQHELEQQLRQHQNLFIGSHHQDPFLPSHYYGGGLFQQQQQQQQQQPQQLQQPSAHHPQAPVQSGCANNNNTTVQFSSSQGQQHQAYQVAAQTYQSPLPTYSNIPNVTSTNQGGVTKVTTNAPTQSGQSSGNNSPSYVAIPPPLPLPPNGFTLNPVGNGRPVLQRQSSGGNLVPKSQKKPQQSVQPHIKVKPLAGNDIEAVAAQQQQQQQQPQQLVCAKHAPKANLQLQQVQQQQQQHHQHQHQQENRQNDYQSPPQYPGVVANKTSPPQVPMQQTGAEQHQQQQQRELRRSFEMIERMQSLTLSQPDLTKLLEKQAGVPKILALSKTDHDLPLKTQSAVATPSGSPQQLETAVEDMQLPEQQFHAAGERPQLQHTQQQFQQPMVLSESSSPQASAELDHAAVANRATRMVERLSHENNTLRKELQSHYGKLSKLQKFEMEIKKISDAYEGLVKHSQRRENLEKLMRLKLDTEMKKFKAVNNELKEQLDRALSQIQHKDIYNQSGTDLRHEINKKDSMISKLLSQNKEVTSAKERLDIESTAQRSTLQEQRTHIEILDKALSNAQASIIRMEEELRKKATQDEKIEELQRAVSQLQLAAAKRESVEHRLRTKLEEEIRNLKKQNNSNVIKSSDTDEGIASDCESTTGFQSQGLLQQLREKDHRILSLESEMLKWEQRYLEESALRHVAVDAVSMPKDMRIAALEQSSAETEKIIADARSDRLKHLEEVYQANRRVAELESHVKSQAAQIAERDAMIAVLQKHSSLGGSRTSSVTSLRSSPLHSPLQTLSSPLPSSLSSLITSTVASIMSLSQSLPSSGTNSPSRQSSVLSTDSNVFQEVKTSSHTKSNSDGSSISNDSSRPSTAAFRDLQQRIAAQAALLHSMQQNGGDQLSKVLWQV